MKYQKTIDVTIHKCVCNVMTGPKPTQYTKLGKYMVKRQNQNESKSTKFVERGLPNASRRGCPEWPASLDIAKWSKKAAEGFHLHVGRGCK